ncbi:MAG: hypothetical protein WD159_00735, partial [Patescibacteria group bacterium]
RNRLRIKGRASRAMVLSPSATPSGGGLVKIAEPAVAGLIGSSAEEATRRVEVEKSTTRELLRKNSRGKTKRIAPLGRAIIWQTGEFHSLWGSISNVSKNGSGLQAAKPEDPGNRRIPALMD